MPGRTRRALANSAIQAGSQAITWVLSWVLLVVLPRYLGDEHFGKLFFAISYSMIFGTFVNLGVRTYFVREVAVLSNPDDVSPDDEIRTSTLQNLIANVFTLRIVLALAIYCIMVATIHVLPYDDLSRKAVMIIGLAVCIGNLTGVLGDVYQGLEAMLVPNVGLIVEKALTTGVCAVLLINGYALVSVCFVYLAGASANFLIVLFCIRRRVTFGIRWHGSTIRQILVGGLPFLVWVIFGEIYVRIDVVMLSLMTDDAVVGWYGGAFRLYSTLLFVPHILNTVVFPPLARMGSCEDDDGAFGRATERLMNLLLFAALPIGAGTIVIADPIVKLLYGDGAFLNAAPSLKIFGVSIVLVCVDVMLGTALVAKGKEKPWACMAIAAAIFNPAMNAWMIPLSQETLGNGGIGAAIATALTEALMMLGALCLMPPGVFTRRNLVAFLKGAVVCGLMVAGLTYMTQTGMTDNVLVLIATGAVFYGTTALAVGVLPWDDIRHIVDALRRK